MNMKSKLRHYTQKDANLFRLLTMLLAVVVIMTLLKPRMFLSLSNLQSMAYQMPEFGIMAIGVMLAMIIGGIDLSVVGIANLSAIVTAKLILMMVGENTPPAMALGAVVVAVLCGIAVGVVAGGLNGLFISKVGIPPILATLGSMELFTGVAIIITKGQPISGLPEIYSKIVSGTVMGIVPMPLVIFIGVALVTGKILSDTSFGYKIYLIGTNEKAAKFTGLNTEWLKIRTYMYSGILSSIAGLIMLGNYNSAKASYGSAYTLLAILIVVLGGVNPEGGFGTTKGVVVSVVLLQALSSALNMFPMISSFYKPLLWGGFLVLALLLNHYTQLNETKRLMRES